MKRICVVTWCYSANFGTCLQAYALYQKLRGAGYDTVMSFGIGRRNWVKDFFIRLFSKVGIVQLKDHFEAKIRHTENQVRRLKVAQKWAVKNMHIVQFRSAFRIERFIDGQDCFIAGSDQIWNTFHGFSPMMFLDFAKGKKRISYASSLGTRTVNPVYKDSVRDLLSRFMHIAVRENSSVEVLSRLLNRDDIVQVVDPTMLFSGEEWLTLIARGGCSNIKPVEPYLFCYLIGDRKEYKQQIKTVRRKTGLERVLIVRSIENPVFDVSGAKIIDNVSPFDFVALLAGASFVCTDSFHATAFSLNLNRSFVEFLRFNDGDMTSQNSRIFDLLSRYGMERRVFDENTDEWVGKIDFDRANVKMAKDRDLSFKWLLNAIEK